MHAQVQKVKSNPGPSHDHTSLGAVSFAALPSFSHDSSRLAVRAILAERQPREGEILRQRQPGSFSDLPPANAEFWDCSSSSLSNPTPIGVALDNARAWVRRTVAALNLFQLGRLTQSERNV